jgi:diadenosine tetraphosphate (Ap4A) HIT family hydrolase
MSRTIPRDEALRALDVWAGDPCVMCRLAEPSHAADEVLFATEHAVVRLDRFGATHGHLLVVLRGHETRLEALPWARVEALHHAAW